MWLLKQQIKSEFQKRAYSRIKELFHKWVPAGLMYNYGIKFWQSKYSDFISLVF